MTNYLERKEEILAKVKEWGTPYEEILKVFETNRRGSGTNQFDNEAGILEQIDKCVPPENGANMIFYIKQRELTEEEINDAKIGIQSVAFTIERVLITLHK